MTDIPEVGLISDGDRLLQVRWSQGDIFHEPGFLCLCTYHLALNLVKIG